MQLVVTYRVVNDENSIFGQVFDSNYPPIPPMATIVELTNKKQEKRWYSVVGQTWHVGDVNTGQLWVEIILAEHK